MSETLRCFCGSIALYHVDRKGFCAKHRKDAVVDAKRNSVKVGSQIGANWDQDWDRSKARNIARPKRDALRSEPAGKETK